MHMLERRPAVFVGESRTFPIDNICFSTLSTPAYGMGKKGEISKNKVDLIYK